MENKQAQETKKSQKKIKCCQCRKKLGLFQFTCKCGKIFCQTHLSPHNHNCTYDYKKEKKELIINNNPKLASKMIKI
mgnify:FL=1|jgi:hypothetical protein